MKNRCINKVLQLESNIYIELRFTAMCEYGLVNRIEYFDEIEECQLNSLLDIKEDVKVSTKYRRMEINRLRKNSYKTINLLIKGVSTH